MSITRPKEAIEKATRQRPKKSFRPDDGYKNSLEGYREKRDFDKTPEPGGADRWGSAKTGGLFVVQKHSARALHYDLRLEYGGVLMSWAIPKGPPDEPGEKRLAVHVEDHPLEYADFEGVIPKGEYGAGAVMIWDRGFWIPDKEPAEGFSRGALKFRLVGKKLYGSWALVKSRAASMAEKDDWLIIKERNDELDKEERLTDELSIVSRRGLKEIAEAPESIWTEAEALPYLPGRFYAAKEKMPGFMPPELSMPSDAPPLGDRWLHEIKFDGYRVLARIKDRKTAIYTRNGNLWTQKFPAIASAFSKLLADNLWLDAEIVFMLPDGRTSFNGLQDALKRQGGENELSCMVFDILHFNGYNLRDTPLEDRKRLLKAIMLSDSVDSKRIKYADHIRGRGNEVFKEACRMGLEGIVSKDRHSFYRHGRTRDWIKAKCHKRQEFIVCGYTKPKGAREGFGALVTGVHKKDGKLKYTGRVGTGFNEKTFSEMWKRLHGAEIQQMPFDSVPEGASVKGVTWVQPRVVIEVEFSEWTKEGVMRHPSFIGIREDKEPEQVVEEVVELQGTPAAAAGAVNVAGVKLTKPEKFLYPGITKQDLSAYYGMVSDYMLAHISGRPLTLVRCPEGFEEDCFYQKHANKKLPAGINVKPLKETENTVEDYMMVDSYQGIVGLVQMGVLEIHTWNSRFDDVERPDRIVFDIDPAPGLPWARLVEGAYLLRAILDELGLKSFAKTTGGKGVHVVLPIKPELDWDEIKYFTKNIADYMAKGLPERFTSKMAKERRKEKIFIDYMRNIRGATAIEAYSTRAKENAPISLPVSWDELPEIRPDSFTVDNLDHRIRSLSKDPWQGYFELEQRITREMREKME